MNLSNSILNTKTGGINIYYVQLLLHLVKREFIIQYKRSFLGVLWSLLLPLGQLVVLVFVFQNILPQNIQAYPVFLFCALLPWNWFSLCISAAGPIFINNRDLCRKPNFSPYMLLIVNTLSNLILFMIALPILFIIMLYYNIPITLSLFTLPILIILQGILTVGLGLFIATLNTFYADINHIVGVALMMIFFLTPVFYGYEAIGEKFRILYFINPIASLINNYRLIIYDGIFPSINSMLYLAISSTIICILGTLIYNKNINEIIDII